MVRRKPVTVSSRLRTALLASGLLGVAISTLQAAPELRFTDITSRAGTGGPSKSDGLTGGHGVFFADVDDDGHPDLYISMIFEQPMPDLFFRNRGGDLFSEEGRLRGLADFDLGSHGACFADLDNDGDYDLFNGTTWHSREHPARNNVFRSIRGRRFVDIGSSSGIPADRTWPTRAVLTFDMDGDGDLDLFGVTNYRGSGDPENERNEVYRNDGGLRFTPIEAGALSTAPCGQGATDTDFDGDGDIDVLAANREGPVNILRNDGRGSFTLVAPEKLGILHRAEDGITVADVDGDGDLDLLLAGNDHGHLYLQSADGSFSLGQSFRDTHGYMGGFADLDLDGDPDLIFAGDDRVYLNDGKGSFARGPEVPGSGLDDPRGIAFADIDLDGDPDFAVACKRSRNALIRNESRPAEEGLTWLKVKLVSPQGQAGAFGAKVRVHARGSGKDDNDRDDDLGRRLGFREARSNQGYLGQDDPVLHFGLGGRRRVDVSVTFLDGTTVRRENVAANRTLFVDARLSGDDPADRRLPARRGKQWAPYLEWTLSNPGFEGNPFELLATATFTHERTGARHRTGMFHAGNENWKFRFSGTRPGRWTLRTECRDPELDGWHGEVTIEASPQGYGFVTGFGDKWARQRGTAGALEAFVPQFVMYGDPLYLRDNEERFDEDRRRFLVDHGFTGFHVPVFCRWFDIEKDRARNIDRSDPDPDPRTFEALERFILRTHAVGGTVHLWMWGDEQRTQTPKRWGVQGPVDRRLQRYLAARLGPLPGWTMGYGFDLFEWARRDELDEWHRHLSSHLGWPHLLGARSHTNRLHQICEALDYASYEQHRPDQARYVETIRARPFKPSFSEDRFRVRGRPKDYSFEMTRRGLWHSALAGGVANIWGNLKGEQDGANMGRGVSSPYPDAATLRTCTEFFRERFRLDMRHDDEVCENGAALVNTDRTLFIAFCEDTDRIALRLPPSARSRAAIAVDTRAPYREIDIGTLGAPETSWKAPRVSDWAIAVGRFGRRP